LIGQFTLHIVNFETSILIHRAKSQVMTSQTAHVDYLRSHDLTKSGFSRNHLGYHGEIAMLSYQMTRKDHEYLARVRQGQKPREIALAEGISIRSVQLHLERARRSQNQRHRGYPRLAILWAIHHTPSARCRHSLIRRGAHEYCPYCDRSGIDYWPEIGPPQRAPKQVSRPLKLAAKLTRRQKRQSLNVTQLAKMEFPSWAHFSSP
jgi:hypothetical protein